MAPPVTSKKEKKGFRSCMSRLFGRSKPTPAADIEKGHELDTKPPLAAPATITKAEIKDGPPSQDEDHVVLSMTEPATNTEQEPSKEEPQEPDSRRSEWTRMAYGSLKAALKAVVLASDAFPPVKPAAEALIAVCETIDTVLGNKEQVKDLILRFQLLEKILASSPPDMNQDVKDRLNGLTRTLQDKADELKKKRDQGLYSKVIFAEDDQGDLAGMVDEISFAIEVAMLDVTLANHTQTLRAVNGIDWLKEQIVESKPHLVQISDIRSDVAWLKKKEILSKLELVANASFSNGIRRDECIPGSRVSLLAQLLAWANDPNAPHVFWLSGMAGTGKTAISETFCSHLSKRGLLGASFFCSIEEQARTDVYRIIPSLARSMAETYPQFGEALAQRLENCGDVRAMKLDEQYTTLILEPAAAAFKEHEVIVLNIDALDECNNTKGDVEEFIDVVQSHRAQIPLKVFLTSRPEPPITDIFEGSTTHRAFRLHDVEDSIVHADVVMYLNYRLGRMAALRKHYGSNWPPPEVDKIAERSGNLFIVAATIVNYIESSSGQRLKRFQKFGGPDTPDMFAVGRIHDLYQQILTEAFKGLERDEIEIIHSILSLMMSARQLLSINDYAGLVKEDVTTVREGLRSLQSVVQVPEEDRDDSPVSIYHASFADYIMATKDAEVRPWAVDRLLAHATTAGLCFKLMDDELRVGVSGSITSYRSNDDQPQPLSVRTDLRYTCLFWVDHILLSAGSGPIPDQLQQNALTFLKSKSLYWIEVLSAIKSVDLAQVLAQLSKDATLEELKPIAQEISTFVHKFRTPIAHSAPHLYLSALPFHLASSTIKIPVFEKISGLPVVHHTPKVNQQIAPRIVKTASRISRVVLSPDGRYMMTVNHTGLYLWNSLSLEPYKSLPLRNIVSAAFSPDGNKIALCSMDEAILVLDINTGDQLYDPLQEHEGAVRSIAFSPDGKRLVSGSDDCTLQLWNVETGQSLSPPMTGHEGINTPVLSPESGSVLAAAFSPDGYLIASGSCDRTILLWDGETGELLGSDAFEGHTDGVTCLAFSPDGSRIVSGSFDKSVRVWDVDERKELFPALLGHEGNVWAVSFSPDGKLILSCSDDGTIRLWDAATGQAHKALKFSDKIKSAIFSADGTGIITGSGMGVLQLIKLTAWDELSQPKVGHEGPVKAVTFSPDGKVLVTASEDKTVRRWDVETGEAIGEPMKGHDSWVLCVAVSPDGTLIASGSTDHTMRIWDFATGEDLLGPLRVIAGALQDIAFSPDGTKLVTAATDKTIRIWDPKTGEPLSEPIKGHTLGVYAVAWFDNTIVTGSADKTLRLWNAATGEPIGDPLTGHERSVQSVAVSPDGRLIVSASPDKTIRIWSRETREQLRVLKGHMEMVSAVAVSPLGDRIVSGCWDGSFRVWNVDTGEVVADPLPWQIGNKILSVAWSPDGRRIALGADDKSIRVWDANALNLEDDSTRGTSTSAEFIHQYPLRSLRFGDDGWIRNRQGDLLLWVLPELRYSFHFPGLQCVLGGERVQSKIQINRASCHGKRWKRCLTPKEAACSKDEGWPVSRSLR